MQIVLICFAATVSVDFFAFFSVLHGLTSFSLSLPGKTARFARLGHVTSYKARQEPEEIDQDVFPPNLSVFIVSTGCLSLGTRYCVLVISKFMS